MKKSIMQRSMNLRKRRVGNQPDFISIKNTKGISRNYEKFFVSKKIESMLIFFMASELQQRPEGLSAKDILRIHLAESLCVFDYK